MAIPLTGPGGLFTRIGRIFGTMDLINAQRGFEAGSAVDAIVLSFDGDEAVTDSIYASLAAHRGSSGGLIGSLRGLAQSTVVAMVREDFPQPSLSITDALRELVRQMEADSETVAATTVAASAIADGGNVGNAVLVPSVKLPSGENSPHVIPETVVAVAVSDGQAGGGALTFRESVQLRGQFSVGVLEWDWPQGSGSLLNLQSISALDGERGGRGTWLANGSFSEWSETSSSGPEAPDRWVVEEGAAGVEILEDSSEGLGGGSALAIAGGAENTTVTQTFGDLDGSRLAIPASSHFLGVVRLKMDATPAAGVLRIALVDGAGTVLSDGDGNASSVSVNLTSTSTGAYDAVALDFRTPAVVPEVVKLQLRLTTPLSAGRTLLVDEVALTTAAPLYRGGPSFALFAGSTPIIRGDRWEVTTTNSNLTGFSAWFDRCFGLRTLGLRLPSSGSPTIDDDLISATGSS